MLKLYNTLTRKIEEFKPLNPPRVGMYTCGPTVYDYMHIGNLRTFLLSDILFRVLRDNGYEVKTVENITDIDDKIISRAKEKEISIKELAEEYTRYFKEDISSLNILPAEIMPRATEHIEEMIEYIKKLSDKGLAYQAKDGSVYFAIAKFPSYGQLSEIKKESLKTGIRISADEYTKENVQDFALWKRVESEEVGFPSPWGRGRPGWHLECSVMSQKYLGKTFDLHLGGVDLIFPHHENEIAQSEGKTGKKFVNYFIHGAHMLVDGKKMSKSLGNIYTVSDVIKKAMPDGRQGFDPLALRYLYLQTHYRQEMNFTWKALQSAQNALDRLLEVARLQTSERSDSGQGCVEYEREFLAAINDDLNMPEALSIVWDLVKSDCPTSAKAESLFKFDEVLGLNLSEKSKVKSEKLEIPEEVMRLVREREELRRQKRFHLADQLRNKIKKMGFLVEDKNGKSFEVLKIIKYNLPHGNSD